MAKSYLIESLKEPERLDFQNTIDVYDLEQELQNFDWKDCGLVLDAGCGHGNVIDKLANSGVQKIHGLELCQDRVAIAQSRFKDHSGITVHQGSLYESGFSQGSYDTVFCRYLFEHLDAPLRAIQEIERILRPNGQVFLVNFDDVFFNFHTKNLELNQQLTELQKKLPQDFEIGRKLPQMLKASGFSDVQWSARTYFFQGERMKLEIENTKMRLEQAQGMLAPFFPSASAYDRFAESYLAEMQDECNVMSMTKFLIKGYKAGLKVVT